MHLYPQVQPGATLNGRSCAGCANEVIVCTTRHQCCVFTSSSVSDTGANARRHVGLFTGRGRTDASPDCDGRRERRDNLGC